MYETRIVEMCIRGTFKRNFENLRYTTIKSKNLSIKLTKALNIVIQDECTKQKGKNTHLQKCDEFGRTELLRPHGL